MSPAAAQEAHTEILLGGPPNEKPYAYPFYWGIYHRGLSDRY